MGNEQNIPRRASDQYHGLYTVVHDWGIGRFYAATRCPVQSAAG